MIREKLINIILIATCLLLYGINTALRNVLDIYFLRCHFNDMLAPIIVLSFASLLLNSINRHSIKKLWIILLSCCGCSFVWEFCAIFIYPASTFDWWDILFIFWGGIIYWLFSIFIINKEDPYG